MYYIKTVLTGFFEEVKTNDLWYFKDSECFYLGNGIYVSFLHVNIYPTNEDDIIPIFVKYSNDQTNFEEV